MDRASNFKLLGGNIFFNGAQARGRTWDLFGFSFISSH